MTVLTDAQLAPSLAGGPLSLALGLVDRTLAISIASLLWCDETSQAHQPAAASYPKTLDFVTSAKSLKLCRVSCFQVLGMRLWMSLGGMPSLQAEGSDL